MYLTSSGCIRAALSKYPMAFSLTCISMKYEPNQSMTSRLDGKYLKSLNKTILIIVYCQIKILTAIIGLNKDTVNIPMLIT